MRLWPKRADPPAPVAPPIDEDLPPAQRRRMAAPKKRLLAREVIAVRVVEALRHKTKTAWYLPNDIDETLEWWCDKHQVVPPSCDLIRELIKKAPGVTLERLRLKQRPDLEWVREQLRADKKPDDRAHLYRVESVAEASEARTSPAHAPPLARPSRTRSDPAPGKDPDSLKRFRKRSADGDDDIVIGHALPGASDAHSASAPPPRPARRAA
jgi:hypothetical protein